MPTDRARLDRAGGLLGGVAKVLLVACWFALATGLAEAARVYLARYVLGQYVHRSLHVVWTAPASYVALFAVPALALVAVMSARRRELSFRIVTFVFATLATLAVLLGVPRLSKWAVVALAIGIGTQVARLAGAREAAALALLRRTVPVLALLVALAAGGLFGYAWYGESRAAAALPRDPHPGPNVLLVVMDTVRAQNMSLYGYSRETSPEIDRFARRSVVFDRAYTTAPWTLPSHASMFTGRYHRELNVGWFEPLDATYPTLAEVLSRRGYATGGFVANTLFCDEQSGLGRGFTRYRDFQTYAAGEIFLSSTLARELISLPWPASFKHAVLPHLRKSADDVNREALSWLDDSSGRPFFAFLNYIDAHEPYLPPEPFALRFADRRPSAAYIDDDRRYSADEIAELIAAYDGGIAYVDDAIGRLLAELDRRGLLANTVVVITSDHGEEFGEHGYMSHSNSLHVQGLHVPLLVALPGGAGAGLRVASPVTLRDLPATVLAAVGAASGELPGESLDGYWRAGGASMSPILSEVDRAPNVAPWLPVAAGDLDSIVKGRFHFIRNADGSELLYDLLEDPYEARDLAREREHARTFGEMRNALDTVSPNHGEARAEATSP